MTETSLRARIESKLTASLRPIFLEIKDDFAQHVGHAGHRPEGETHFTVVIASAAFEGLTPVARHRLIYAALADEIKNGLHAIKIMAFSGTEYTNRL